MPFAPEGAVPYAFRAFEHAEAAERDPPLGPPATGDRAERPSLPLPVGSPPENRVGRRTDGTHPLRGVDGRPWASGTHDDEEG